MDGTLTQTNQLIFDSFNHIAQKYVNKRLSPKEVIALFGPPEKECIESFVGAARIDSAMEEYYQFYRERHSDLARLYPGIRDVLEYLQSKKILIGLFTGKGRGTTEITLEEFAIKKYFSVTITGDDVDEFKPSGDGIKKILEKFSLQSNDVLMVGDAVADVKASRETGVEIASVLWDSYGKEDVLQLSSDYIFHDVHEFLRWLKDIYH